MRTTSGVTRRHFLKTASAATAAAPFGTHIARASDARPPNIVFVYTDDHGPWALGLEHPQAHTPRMDRLFAEEGARLVNAFVATPVCSPARAALFTGRYATEVGIHDWIHPEEDAGLEPDSTTWVQLLAEAGYATGLMGKWHLGRAERHHPTQFGFDEFVGFLQHGPPADPVMEKEGREQTFGGLTIDILSDHVIEFIERHRAEPFMVMLSTRSPHRSWDGRAEDRAPYEGVEIEIPDYPGLDTERVRNLTRDYLVSVTSIDRNLGRILDTLDELDLGNDTIVVFAGNEGNGMGHNGFWGKGNAVSVLRDPPPDTENIPGGRRPNLTDTVLRVPTAVRWPGVIEPGAVIEETVTNMDWFPTLLAMAGVEQPEGIGHHGRNILPLLEGEASEDWDNDLYAEYSPHHGIQAHMRAWRTRRWKLVRDFLNPWRDEFYDLANDPEERENLIHDGRFEVCVARQALHERILAKMEELEDPVRERAEE
ncbi:MAG: sulfatase [Candidatus Hydrogenedentota bacterium]